jgi:chemotaxis protein methyltransferase CheR
MTLLTNLQVSDDLLSRYTTLIYDVTGIRMSPQKKTLLSNRVRRRLRETGIASFEQYYALLRRLKRNDPEWAAFLQEITTHETYLFRDEAHWNWLRTEYLPAINSAAKAGSRPRGLRVWSAACSTGDEAYTIAACIASDLPGFEQWQIKILGTDIGADTVKQASSATFGSRAMRLVPAEIRDRWFVQVRGAELWQPHSALRRMTTFRQHNLLEPLHEPAFDLIVLKNVLIYFDTASKQRVVENLRLLMRPGTMLIAGAAEGITDLVKDLRRSSPWLYAKV